MNDARALLAASAGTAYPAAQLAVYQRGRAVIDEVAGWLDPDERRRPTSPETRFDLASVSKLFVAVAFMSLVERGRAALDQPVGEVFPDFDGARPVAPYPNPLGRGDPVIAWPAGGSTSASGVTFRHLLTHTSGLPAWLPIWRDVLTAKLPLPEARDAYLEAITTTPFAYPPGARVVYSDLGLILLGLATERLAGAPLDAVVRERVTAPLGLRSIGYGPIPCNEAAPTELYGWRDARTCGEVHDENAFALGGVAGHAGLFGTARDVAAFAEALRRCLAGERETPLRPETVAEMARLHAEEGDVRRGLGFALWSPNPRAMSHALGPGAFGHLGFTGTSVWIDPGRDLAFACLTNHAYYGRDGEDTLTPFRLALSRLIGAS